MAVVQTYDRHAARGIARERRPRRAAVNALHRAEKIDALQEGPETVVMSLVEGNSVGGIYLATGPQTATVTITEVWRAAHPVASDVENFARLRVTSP